LVHPLKAVLIFQNQSKEVNSFTHNYCAISYLFVEINLILFGFQRLFSEGIKEILEKKKFIKIQIENQSISQFLTAKKTIENANIVILKNNLSNHFFGSEISELKKINPKIKIIAIGENYESELSQALNHKVDGFLHTDTSSKILLEAVNNIINDEFYIDPASYKHYINLLSNNDDSNRKNKLINKRIKLKLKMIITIDAIEGNSG
jgi:DNA-binding NarL/FixJ family response regulator